MCIDNTRIYFVVYGIITSLTYFFGTNITQALRCIVLLRIFRRTISKFFTQALRCIVLLRIFRHNMSEFFAPKTFSIKTFRRTIYDNMMFPQLNRLMFAFFFSPFSIVDLLLILSVTSGLSRMCRLGLL